MWSKILILTFVAVFLTATGTGLMAHDGGISNLIKPDEADEHPWGGGNEYTGDPSLVASPTDDPSFIDSKYYFFGVTIKHSWLSIRQLIWEHLIDNDVKTGTQSTPIPIDNNTDTAGQGARN